ncbi:MAG: putative bifunctional diguanylate cyclase/phosphodiesterase [Halochromatium sp.]
MIDSVLKSRTTRSLRVRYLIGLSAIALLVTASFVTMRHVISEQRNFARLVNLASHQSGLVSRVSYFASQMVDAEEATEFDQARAQVGRTINRIQEAHRLLREGSPEEGVPRVINENLRIIYEDPMVGLDGAIQRFLERARTVYHTEMDELDRNSVAYIFLNVYGPHALEPILDAAVEEYQRIGRQAILRIERFELAIWITALTTLLLELLVIFRPLDKRVRQAISSLEAAVATLQDTRARLVSAQALAHVGDWQWNPQRETFICSGESQRILGLGPNDVEPGLEALSQRVRPEDRALWQRQIERAMAEPNAGPRSLQYRIRRADGQERTLHQQIIAQHDASGDLVQLAGTIQDVTEQHELAKRLQRLSQNIPGFLYEYVLATDGSSRFPFASQGISELFGVWPEQVYEDASMIFACIHAEDVERISNSLFVSARELSLQNEQYRIQHPQRGEIWVESHATPERLPDGGTRWYGYVWEVTDRKRSEEQIRELALFDPLTGLANRRLLRDRMEHALAAAQRSAQIGAVLMLDLDHFKTLNDTRGHDAGDALLVEVGQRMSERVRAADTIARLGGDEFVVLLESLSLNKEEAREHALKVAETIREALNQPYQFGDDQPPYQTSVSIGISFFEDRSLSADDLLQQADIGMFQAKESGRNCIRPFTEQRLLAIQSRTSLLQELRQALQQQEFLLYYQPQFYPDGRIYGVEVLLRWQSPSRGLVSPGHFIPLAEDTGLIVPIGEWVLNAACEHVRQLRPFVLPEAFSVSINISPRQFSDPGFLSKVEQVLASHAEAARFLSVELTENALFVDMEHAVEILEQLRRMGIGIELDDFGTGYSSLSYLKRLPLDVLKLDGSLVKESTGDASDAAIVRAVIAMAKTLSLTIIAEGVETQAQRDFLAREGCDVLQGYLLARPMPFDELRAMLAAEQSTQCVTP